MGHVSAACGASPVVSGLPLNPNPLWLQTAAITAEVEKRDLTASEKRGPFEVYRWATSCGSYKNGHPLSGAPQYGVVDASQVRYRAPIFIGLAEPRDAPNPIHRLVTDMLRRF